MIRIDKADNFYGRFDQEFAHANSLPSPIEHGALNLIAKELSSFLGEPVRDEIECTNVLSGGRINESNLINLVGKAKLTSTRSGIRCALEDETRLESTGLFRKLVSPHQFEGKFACQAPGRGDVGLSVGVLMHNPSEVTRRYYAAGGKTGRCHVPVSLTIHSFAPQSLGKSNSATSINPALRASKEGE